MSFTLTDRCPWCNERYTFDEHCCTGDVACENEGCVLPAAFLTLDEARRQRFACALHTEGRIVLTYKPGVSYEDLYDLA